METTTKNAAAMTAACVSYAAVRIGATTAHAGDLGRFQGRTMSAAGIAVRDRAATPTVGLGVVAMDAPTQGSAHPRLEGPPV
jgi:hypothetical protein